MAAAAAGVVCGRNERRDNNGDGRGTSLLAECQRGEHFPGSEGEALYAQDAYDEALLWPPCAGGAAAATRGGERKTASLASRAAEARVPAARINRHGLCCSPASERLASGRVEDSSRLCLRDDAMRACPRATRRRGWRDACCRMRGYQHERP